jgi:hypothetical protein
MYSKWLGIGAAAALLVTALAGAQAHAQYYYPSPYAYRPYYYPNPYYVEINPLGDTLRGAATAIDAQGQFNISNQQAKLLNEQVRQARIETRRREIEERMWERSLQEPLSVLQERARREQVRQAQTAPVAEVVSGQALNDLLKDIQILQGQGVKGPAVPLDEAVVRQVHVIGAASAGSPGLLKAAELPWPLLLTQEQFRGDRERIEALLNRATQQAVAGRADPRTVEELQLALADLEAKLKALNRATRDEDLRPAQHVQANRFVAELRGAARLLQEPEAGGYVTGRYTAQGKSVAELVDSMTRQGLRFAPASGGNDASYLAVHNALAAYDIALQSAAGAALPERSVVRAGR